MIQACIAIWLMDKTQQAMKKCTYLDIALVGGRTFYCHWHWNHLPNLLGIPSHPPGTVDRDFSPHQEHR